MFVGRSKAGALGYGLPPLRGSREDYPAIHLDPFRFDETPQSRASPVQRGYGQALTSRSETLPGPVSPIDREALRLGDRRGTAALLQGDSFGSSATISPPLRPKARAARRRIADDRHR